MTRVRPWRQWSAASRSRRSRPRSRATIYGSSVSRSPKLSKRSWCAGVIHRPEGIGETIRVAIVEDDPTLRAGLRDMLDAAEAISCTGAFATAEDALVAITP